MVSKSRWKKRKLFTFQFKGRLPRALLWNKWVYELWFRYCQIAAAENQSIPTEFGDINAFEDFESWWRHPDYGFELFCEQYEKPAELVSDPSDQDSDALYIKISKRSDPEVVYKDVKRILNTALESEEYSSTARFQPSVSSMRNINREQLTNYTKVYDLSKSMTDQQIAYEMGFLTKPNGQDWSINDFMRPIPAHEKGTIYESSIRKEAELEWKKFQRVQIRKVQRYRAGCRKLLRRVSLGVFP